MGKETVPASASENGTSGHGVMLQDRKAPTAVFAAGNPQLNRSLGDVAKAITLGVANRPALPEPDDDQEA